jgi:hypothetical protein
MKAKEFIIENIKKLEILKENFYHRIYDRIDKKRSFKETFQ